MSTRELSERIRSGTENVRVWLAPGYSDFDNQVFCVTNGSIGARFQRQDNQFNLLSLSRPTDGFGEFNECSDLEEVLELLELSDVSQSKAFDFIRLAVRRWQWANNLPQDELT